jgi:hypothetical protein
MRTVWSLPGRGAAQGELLLLCLLTYRLDAIRTGMLLSAFSSAV